MPQRQKKATHRLWVKKTDSLWSIYLQDTQAALQSVKKIISIGNVWSSIKILPIGETPSELEH